MSFGRTRTIEREWERKGMRSLTVTVDNSEEEKCAEMLMKIKWALCGKCAFSARNKLTYIYTYFFTFCSILLSTHIRTYIYHIWEW
jgi:hypothetical protein